MSVAAISPEIFKRTNLQRYAPTFLTAIPHVQQHYEQMLNSCHMELVWTGMNWYELPVAKR